jgi:hypothetical protein
MVAVMRLLVAALSLLALAGCSSGSNSAESAAPATVTVTASQSPADPPALTPSPTPSEEADPYAPNVGDQALTIGETRVGRDIRTTLAEVRYPYPPGTYRQPEAGNDFVGLRIRQCLRNGADMSDGELYSTYNGEWSAATKRGNQVAGGGSSWNDWPAPKFPEYVTMNPGDCLQGWIAFEVPRGTAITKFIWRPDGVTTAEWRPVGPGTAA